MTRFFKNQRRNLVKYEHFSDVTPNADAGNTTLWMLLPMDNQMNMSINHLYE